MKISYVLALVSALYASTLSAFDINGRKWPGGEVEVYLDLTGSSASGVLWNTGFAAAMQDWNEATPFNFVLRPEFRNPCSRDGLIGVNFTDSVCGDAYGDSTLAVTVFFIELQVLGPSRIVEADIVFNNEVTFDIFDGPLFSTPGVDFQRVALHELGHALGMGHEEDATAIMAPNIGNLDRLQPDDILGATVLYSGLSNCVIADLPYAGAAAELGEDDCTVDELTVGEGDDSFIDVYRFDLTGPTDLNFATTSAALDSVLILADAKLQFLAADPKNGPSCDSELQVRLPAGSYFLLANTFVQPRAENCDTAGPYNLAVEISPGFQLLSGGAGLLGGFANASFRGGISADDGQSFANQFSSTDTLDVAANILIDPAHQGQPGFLVVAAQLSDGSLFLRDQQGNFIAYNGVDLIHTADKTLAALESLEIINNLIVADSGFSEIVVDFYFGYGLETNPAELYFNQSPLTMAISP